MSKAIDKPITYVPSEDLKSWIKQIFINAKAPADHAEIISDVLVDTSLRGVDSHGVIWVKKYIERIENGAINPNPKLKIHNKTSAILHIDGDQGLGMVVGTLAMQKSIELAALHGIASTAVFNSTHFGAAAYYPRLASSKNMIGLSFSNAGPAMAPCGSLTMYLGTNPMAFAVPGGIEGGVVLDMAVSQVAGGKVELALRAGEKIPLGWATNRDGLPTDDALTAWNGLMLPLGGYKGYGLGVMIEILCGILSHASFGPHLYDNPFESKVSLNVGHFFIVIDIDCIMSIKQFKQRMKQFVDEIHNCDLAPDSSRIYVPGEIELEKFVERRQTGIPLPQYVLSDLREVGNLIGKPFPW